MLDVKDLSVSYDGINLAVDNISINVQPGRIVGLLGPNGAGKSTLIKGILNLIPHQGTCLYKEEPITKKENMKTISYVEQKSHIDMNFPITVEEVVLMGTYASLGTFHRPGAEERRKAEDALKEVNMLDFSHRQIGQLSGGQLQRVLIARSLAQGADLIFLDEPFVGVDAQSEAIIVELLKSLVAADKTIVVVHHDLSKVVEYFDEIILMDKHLIAQGPVKEVFNAENMKTAYGDTIFVSVKEGESGD